jgi:hypothetical protein
LLPVCYPAFDSLKLQPLTVVLALMVGGQVEGIAGMYLSYQQPRVRPRVVTHDRDPGLSY